MIVSDTRNRGDDRLHDIRRVEPPSDSDFDHRIFTFLIAKKEKSHQRAFLKI